MPYLSASSAATLEVINSVISGNSAAASSGFSCKIRVGIVALTIVFFFHVVHKYSDRQCIFFVHTTTINKT